MMFQTGDIVVNYRKKYKGPFNYLLTRLICFFTTEYWDNEPTSKTYHAEMVYAPADKVEDVKNISQEWPCVKIVSLGHLGRKAIFRLKHKPANYSTLFWEYTQTTLGQKYDWLKLLGLAFHWLFGRRGFGRWIARMLSLKEHDVCSEYVARFYKDWVWTPCSTQKPDYTAPDDILDFCLDHSEIFECLHNQEGDS